MGVDEYYEKMRALARSTRDAHGIRGARVMRAQMRTIYRKHGIVIDLRDGLSWKVRGAYFSDEYGTHVVLKKGLPIDPMVFTMAHELKHHLADRDRLGFCVADQPSEIEVGAEVFAAEFIFPEAEFVAAMDDHGVKRGRCDATDLVRLKHHTGATLSYAGLVKLAERLGYRARGALKKVAWRQLEYAVLGVRDFRRRAS